MRQDIMKVFSANWIFLTKKN